jgi:hypothetical protein
MQVLKSDENVARDHHCRMIPRFGRTGHKVLRPDGSRTSFLSKSN